MPPAQSNRIPAGIWLLVWMAFVFSGWAIAVGWQSRSLPGVEYRQAQTALSAFFVDRDDDFSLAYPTPALGKPWSVPMEFPLYQWTVVVTKRLVGCSLIQAGRAVSVACFVLTLGAVFLLLREFAVARRQRWLVLAVIAASPFYIFYARAFLIETMALMFSAWFGVAYVRAVARRHLWWAIATALCGSGAALVKVTTFIVYALMAAGWSLWWLWRRRGSGSWRNDAVWMAAIVAPALACGSWWVAFADAQKQLNPLADFLVSGNLSDFNFGTAHTRFSSEYWRMRWRIIRDDITWLPLVGFVFAVVALVARRRCGAMLLALVPFGAALLIFPGLYALHPYYFAAVALGLFLAVGLGLVALVESNLAGWIKVLACAVIFVGQAHHYATTYFPVQRLVGAGESIGIALQRFTEEREVVVITGHDWNSMIPFYAERKALMLRADVEARPERVAEGLAGLDGETVGALLVPMRDVEHSPVLAALARRGFDTRPVFVWREVAIFLPAERVASALERYCRAPLPDLALAPGREWIADPKWKAPKVGRGWHAFADLDAEAQSTLDGMQPVPVRLFVEHELRVDRTNGGYAFGAHPTTRLVFAVSPGHWVFETSIHFSPDAYRADLLENERTDGVQLSLMLTDGAENRLVFDRVVDPEINPSDRNWLKVRVPFELATPGTVELIVGPGYRENSVRDWVSLGRTTIESATTD